MAQGPASTTRSRGLSMSAWKESAERNGASATPSWSKLASCASPSPPVSATTVLVVPKSTPIAASAISSPPDAERPAPGFGGVGLGGLREVAADEPAVDLCQLIDLRHRRALVDCVHGGADKPHLHHRAHGADEAGVRGAAGGGKLRPAAGHLLDHARHLLHERAGLGEEGLATHMHAHAH